MSEHDPPESAVEAGTVPLPRSGGYNSETARRVLTAAHEAGEIVWRKEFDAMMDDENDVQRMIDADLMAEKARADEAERENERLRTQADLIHRDALSNWARDTARADEAVALLRDAHDRDAAWWERRRAYLARIEGSGT